ncbi:MAG: hypothetical protein AAGK32_03420, partial [Actinomycetota bacterium]
MDPTPDPEVPPTGGDDERSGDVPDARKWLIAAVAGVAMTVTGLLWDAVMHALDEGLAAREGVFTVANPSHGLVALGVVVSTIGSVGGLARLSRPGVARALVGSAAVLTVALAGVGVATGGTGHDHAPEAAAGEDHHDHDHDADGDGDGDQDHGDHGDAGHGDHALAITDATDGREPTDAEVAAADDLVDGVHDASERFADLADALADGYRLTEATLDDPNPVKHYMLPAAERSSDDELDPTR